MFAKLNYSDAIRALRRSHSLALFLIIQLFGCQSYQKGDLAYQQLPDKVDFNIHIKPIISDRCFTCHGPDENARKGNLRFDVEDAAFSLLDSVENRYAIVPGSINRSELAHRISSDDPDYIMPPPESNLSLSNHEIALLRLWIEQGANWKPHWAFIPPEKPDLPLNKRSDWPNNPIDHFTLEKMVQLGLSPSPEADKERLIRRLSFDPR